MPGSSAFVIVLSLDPSHEPFPRLLLPFHPAACAGVIFPRVVHGVNIYEGHCGLYQLHDSISSEVLQFLAMLVLGVPL